MARLTIPLPPSINSYHRSVTLRSGVSKVLVSKHGRKWKKAALLAAQLQWRGKPLEGDVRVSIIAYFRDRRRDTDNILKPALDLLQAAGVMVNDRQVCEIHLYRAIDKGNPRLEVDVEAIEQRRAA
jgi:crossover junction endodeoxyribonuclease RusA